MITTERRVDRLERAHEQFARIVGAEFKRVYSSIENLSFEMKVFKDEMTVFKDEMKVFKDEMKVFKDEMTVFKDEMEDFKDETRRDRKQMNKRWGEIANKIGTFVEDIVAPSVPRIIRDLYEVKLEYFAVRVKKWLSNGCSKEFDVVVVANNYLFITCTKSTLRSSDVEKFVEDLSAVRLFFPEYKSLKIIGILASLYLDESVLNYAGRKGFFVLGLGEDLMDVVSPKDFKPKEW